MSNTNHPRTFALLALLAACASNDDSGEPKLASFGASTTEVTEQRSVQISAILADPDGSADLLAGSLIDVATGGSYGTFTATSTPGTYNIEVSWTQFNDMSPTNAAPVDGTARELRGDFFDQEGRAAHAMVSVKLRCDSDLEFARGGSCDPWFHSECGMGGCEVTNYTNAIRTGDQMCPIAVHESVCSDCASGTRAISCSTPLAELATCTCQ